MSTNHRFRGLIAEDTPAGNDGDVPGFAQPVTQTEIEELLYGDDWPIEDRLARLREMRTEIADLEAPDFGDEDPLVLVRFIDDAIARLTGLAGEGMDPTSIDHDPSAHRETLSPDSDELDAIEAADAASLTQDDEGPIDKREWIDGDGRDDKSG
jgi:hypothetical protein